MKCRSWQSVITGSFICALCVAIGANGSRIIAATSEIGVIPISVEDLKILEGTSLARVKSLAAIDETGDILVKYPSGFEPKDIELPADDRRINGVLELIALTDLKEVDKFVIIADKNPARLLTCRWVGGVWKCK